MSGKRFFIDQLNRFPKLNSQNHQITSRENPSYNCFGWAVGKKIRIDHTEEEFWPSDIPTKPTQEGLIKVYERYRFKECKDPDFEEGFEKIAIYSADDGEGLTPFHASRQRTKGKFKGQWASKMGPNEDIVHSVLDALENKNWYGTPTYFMKRERR